MPPKTAVTPQPHMGRKIEKIRTLKGIKQIDLAKKIGMAASALSVIENSETIDDDKLQKIADALEMTVDAIKDFNEESVINNIQNNYNYEHSNSNNVGPNATANNHFNPVERMAELYERLLTDKDNEIKLLKEKLKGKGE